MGGMYGKGSLESLESLTEGTMIFFRVERPAIASIEHALDCDGGCRRIDVLQRALVDSPPPADADGA